MKPKDLTGKYFGNLKVLKITSNRDSTGSAVWECKCNCGNENIILVPSRLLNSGNTKSCGCLQRQAASKIGLSRRKHGASRTKSKEGHSQLDYSLWCGIKARCFSKTHERYKDYGKVGITMYRKWRKNFTIFAKYIRTLENCPDEGMLTSRLFGKRIPRSIDRINNKGNYEPYNIKWSTSIEQNNNRSNSVFVVYKNKKQSLYEIVRNYAFVRYELVYERIRKGWSVERALKTKARKIKKLPLFYFHPKRVQQRRRQQAHLTQDRISAIKVR